MSAACRIPPFWQEKPFKTPQSPSFYPTGLTFMTLFFFFYIHPRQVWPFGWECSSHSHLRQWGLDLSQSLRIGTRRTSEHVRPKPFPAWLWGLQWKIVHLMPGDRHIHQRRRAPACPLSAAYSLFRSEMQKQLTYWIVVEERWRVLLLLL